MKTLATLIAFSTLIIYVAAGPAFSDEYPFIPEQLPQHLEGRIQLQAAALQLSTVGGADDYFVSKLKLWDTSTPIKVCFFGGNQALRSRIAKLATQWSQASGYLPLDFGSLETPQSCSPASYYQVRVGFEYKGYWSTVGTDSVNLAAQSEQSMNFALFNVNPPQEPEFTRVVLHEFGHAIGFQHEHQSYKAPCVDEFDWVKIYNYLKGPPNYWDEEQIDHNLKPRPQTEGEASIFDVNSIMLYSFPKSFFKSSVSDPKCYTADNSQISEKDKEAVAKYYPIDVTQAASVREQALSEFNARVDLLSINEFEKSLAKVNAGRLTSQKIGVDSFPGAWNSTSFDTKIFQLPTDRALNVQVPTIDYLNRFNLDTVQ